MTPDKGFRVRRLRLAPFFLAVTILAGCGTTFFLSPAEEADRLAAAHGWRKRIVTAGRFDLTTYSRLSDASDDQLAVYIEGDGNAWLSRNRLSSDPTPKSPYVLELAVRHGDGKVLYVARPCQYTIKRPARGCHPSYWAGYRYAPEVVDAVNRAIDLTKRTARVRRVVLIGYSGGGVVAALAAVRRTDVAKLVTIAANLDIEYWARIDGLTPLRGSVNPVEFGSQLQGIDQVHFVGSEDDVVPPSVTRSFVNRLSDRSRVRLITMRGFDHDCCWIENWPILMTRR